MSKKTFISYILLFAFLFIGAHNFIPHHHHDLDVKELAHHHDENGTHHHHKNDTQKEDHKSNSLSDLFSFFNHAGSTVEVVVLSGTIDHGKLVQVEKALLYAVSFAFNFLKEPPEIPSVPYYLNNSPRIYIPSFCLRGPPSIA